MHTERQQGIQADKQLQHQLTESCKLIVKHIDIIVNKSYVNHSAVMLTQQNTATCRQQI